MKPSQALAANADAVRRIVLAHGSRNPRVFGSVLHGDDTEASDLDLLVDPGEQTSLLDIAKLQVELEHLLAVPVDVLTPGALPDRVRATILAEARPL